MKNRLIFISLYMLFHCVALPQNDTTKGAYLPPADDTWSKKLDSLTNELKKVPRDTSNYAATGFDENFKQKYADDPNFDYQRANSDKTFWKRFKEKINYLIRKILGINTLKNSAEGTHWAVRILSFIVVLVVLYILIRLLMNHKGQWFFQKKNLSVVVDMNDTEQLIKSADFDKLITESEKKGDTRQSIRLYYLWLLKSLKDSEMIDWNPQKTNTDYYNEIKDGRLKEKFSYLSYLFSYIWYGEFQITDDEYLRAKHAFLNHLQNNGKNE